MSYFYRKIEQNIVETLARKKSILLMGARQTGKTTLIEQQCQYDAYYTLLDPELRLRFETNPNSLKAEINALKTHSKDKQLPLIVIDEVQKAPIIMDVIQDIIDHQQAQFILTGSSARNLLHRSRINLLPGRVIILHLHPLSLAEINNLQGVTIEQLLLYGSLPAIFLEKNEQYKENDLKSYVTTYLEEEVRREAIVRNISSFARFLEYAAIEAGNQINLSKLSQEIGVPRNTIAEYYQILQDCLIADRIDPITTTQTRRRLTSSPKYLFFDMGVRRHCARESDKLPETYLSHLFEQFVGSEIIRYINIKSSMAKLRYWRDHNGPEIDYVIDRGKDFIPIEVKWTKNPNQHDCRHINYFLEEYPCAQQAYIICQTPRPMQLTDRILALPWQELPSIIEEL